jgi:hypothetical protein
LVQTVALEVVVVAPLVFQALQQVLLLALLVLVGVPVVEVAILAVEEPVVLKGPLVVWKQGVVPVAQLGAMWQQHCLDQGCALCL